MPKIILPENYWCLADGRTEIIFPYLSTCLAIVITTISHLKICAHLADLQGFPSKKLSNEIHPLPPDFHGHSKCTSDIFEFLRDSMPVEPKDIMNLSIVGPYHQRLDVFNLQDHDAIEYEQVKQVIVEKMKIDAEKVLLKKCTEITLTIHSNGSIKIATMEDHLDQIERDNFAFHRSSLDSPPMSKGSLLKNHSLFKSQKVYAKDDTIIDYRSSPNPA